MRKNYMAGVAKLLGVKLGEIFNKFQLRVKSPSSKVGDETTKFLTKIATQSEKYATIKL